MMGGDGGLLLGLFGAGVVVSVRRLPFSQFRIATMKLRFDELSLGDMFLTKEDHKNIEWLKMTPSDKGSLNAVSVDGVRSRFFNDDQIVNVTRYRQHVLDLRQGDIVQMTQNTGLAFKTTLILGVTEDEKYRNIKIARPLVHGSGFGTTCPTASTYVESYEVIVPLGDRTRDDYYYVVDVDTSALYESYHYMLTADRFRMAVFLRAYHDGNGGDEREMAEILCDDYCRTREKVARIIMDRIENRKDIDFPDRNDSAESVYENNLRLRQILSPYEQKYLKLLDVTRHPL